VKGMNERRSNGSSGDTTSTELDDEDECHQLRHRQRSAMTDLAYDDYSTTRIVVDENEPEIGTFTHVTDSRILP